MAKNLSISWRGKEIENPFIRAVAVAAAVPVVAICCVLAFVGVIVAMCLFVLTFPLHWGLVLFGRRGFVVREHGDLTYSPSLAGFRRAR